jgi:hypothetical protein
MKAMGLAAAQEIGWRKIPWLLKNSLFVSNSQNRGDRKCLPDPRKSIVGLPDAILFLRILRVGVFQHPLPISLRIPALWAD